MKSLFSHRRSEPEGPRSEKQGRGEFTHQRDDRRQDRDAQHHRPAQYKGGHEARKGGHGRHGKLRRMFEHGDLRFVLLSLIAEKPGHGYELIKSIEEATAGLYTPSPGVIYPTLTLLEEQEFVESTLGDKGRKSYQITLAGKDCLLENRKGVDAIFQRLQGVNHHEHGKNLSDEIQQAMHRLRGLLRNSLVQTALSAEQIGNIAAALNGAVDTIAAELKLGEKVSGCQAED